jgi:hypothetical protein
MPPSLGPTIKPQLPASLRLEPLKLAGAGVLHLSAGASLPESTAEVLSGAGQRLSRSFFDGHKQALRVVRRGGTGTRGWSEAVVPYCARPCALA